MPGASRPTAELETRNRRQDGWLDTAHRLTSIPTVGTINEKEIGLYSNSKRAL